MPPTPQGPWSSGPPPKKPRGSVWPWVLGAVAAIGALVTALAAAFPEMVGSEQERMTVYHRLAMLALVGGSVIVHLRAEPGRALRYAAVWLGVGGLLFLGYSLRFEAAALGDRLLAELLPYRGTEGPASITLVADKSGHFQAEAMVDGVPVRFTVDTGATDVMLTEADARRLGFDPAKLSFDKVYSTANGAVRAAPVRLGRIELGPVAVTDVRASVNGAAMRRSLLGMSFLSRTGGWDVKGDKLTLRR